MSLIKLISLIPKEKHAEAYNYLCKVSSFPKARRRLKAHLIQPTVVKATVAAAEAWETTVTNVKSRSKEDECLFARMFIYNYLRKKYDLSDLGIGEIFNFNGRTVNYSLASFDRLIRFDTEFQHRYKQFLKLLENDKPSNDVPTRGIDPAATPTDVLIHRTVNN